jgi:hypothetical protein
MLQIAATTAGLILATYLLARLVKYLMNTEEPSRLVAWGYVFAIGSATLFTVWMNIALQTWCYHA